MHSSKVMRRWLSVVLAVCLVLQAMVLPAAAADTEVSPLLSYLTGDKQTVTSGTGALDKSADVSKVKDLEEFTLTMDFNSTVSSLQTLFYVGSDEAGTQDKYFNLYINGGNTVGIEIRDGSQNPKISASASVAANADHKITLTYLKDKYYKIYIDGAAVLTDTTAANTARFLKSLGMTPNTMVFGKGTRVSGNNYPYTGTISNINIYNKALSEAEILRQHGIVDALVKEPVISASDISLDGGDKNCVDLSQEHLGTVKALTQGTIHARFRVDDPEANNGDNGRMSLFSVSKKDGDDTYASFFVQPGNNVIGLEVKNNNAQTAVLSQTVSPAHVTLKNTDWHTASLSMNKAAGTVTVYVDAEQVAAWKLSSFFADMADFDTVHIGDLVKKSMESGWKFKGDIDVLEVYADPINEANVETLHAPTTVRYEELPLPEGTVKTEDKALYYAGYSGSVSYRIPSVITTKEGTLLAAIDKRRSGAADQGDINTVVRRSEDNGETWEAPITLVDNPAGQDRFSFTIDSSMVQSKSGKIFLLVDMFPESQAIMNTSLLEASSGYKTVDGKRYLVLRDYPNDGTTKSYEKEYTLREDGVVWAENTNAAATKTEYKVESFKTGELTKNGEPAGNIFLYTGENAGELKMVKTSYLWLVTSEDDGKTWSDPVCLNGMVKEDWMVFLGTGPGRGLQIQNGQHKGRILFPVYHANTNVGASQCSALIYSDDDGVTWKLGKSPALLNNLDPSTMTGGLMLTESQVVEVGSSGRLVLFMRNGSGKVYLATSEDGGESWKNLRQDTALYDPYCQMTVIRHTEKVDNKDAYIFMNPSGTGRNNGKVYLGFYDEAKDSFTWPASKLLHEGSFSYSCLTSLEDGTIGAFYEADVPNMMFTRFSPDWITAPTIGPMGAPRYESVWMNRKDNKLTFTANFDQDMICFGKPVLKLKIDGKEAEASFVSGEETRQLVFEYTLTEEQAKTAKTVIVVNIADKGSDATIGNRLNLKPEKDSNEDFNVQGGPTVKSVTVVTPPNTTSYLQGDKNIDLTGISLKAVYSDGSEKTVTEGIELVGEVDLSAAGFKEVTVTYGEKTTAFTIEVRGLNDPVEVDAQVLAENAKANSYQNPASGNDGPASYAFNGDRSNWWHSRWSGTAETANGEAESGLVSENNPIWIQTGFGAVKDLYSVTYLARTDTGNNQTGEYELQVACLQDPAAEPKDTDFVTAKSGTFEATFDLQEIVLEEPVEATHIRFVTKSVTTLSAGNTDKHITAAEIKVYALGEKATAPVLTGIEVKEPAKQTYKQGEPLDTAGMEVTASYKRGEDKNVADKAQIIGYDPETLGEQTLTVVYDGRTAQFTVTVTEGEVQPPEKHVESVTFDEETMEMLLGEEKTLHVTVSPEGVPADLTFTSSDEEILTVDDEGNVKALKPGKAVVTVEAEGKTDTIAITVKGTEAVYEDVEQGAWYYNAVNWAYVNEIMTGLNATTFGPSNNLVRAQFAVILYRMAGSPEVEEKAVTGFADVDADAGNSWYRNAVIWASENGIITGYTSNGLFGTNDNITREQMAAIMYRYLTAKKIEPGTVEDRLSAFPDAGQIQGFAKEAMKWATAKELIKGDGGKLKPQGNANRAEVAIIIQRFSNAYPEAK